MSLIVVMVISFHKIVDNAVGVFVPLSGQVEIDHRRIKAAMSQILLNTPDIDSCLQQMGGVAVTQGVDGDPFFDFELFEHPAQGTLYRSLSHGFLGCRTLFAASSQTREYPERVAMLFPVITHNL